MAYRFLRSRMALLALSAVSAVVGVAGAVATMDGGRVDPAPAGSTQAALVAQPPREARQRAAAADSAGDDLAAARADAAASPEQTRILEDGVVTYEEHEEAIRNFIACATADGAVDVSILGEGRRPTMIGLKRQNPAAVTAEELEASHYASKAITDACQDAHLEAVDWFYASHRAAPTADDILNLYKFLRECVAQEGKEGPGVNFYVSYEGVHDEAIVITYAQALRYSQCALDAEALTGLPVPGPTVID